MIPRITNPSRTASGLAGSRFGALWLLALVAWLVPGDVAGQFSVYPVTVRLEASERAATSTVTVENAGPSPLQVHVYLRDYERAPGGEHAYMEYGAHASTCASRLEAFPDQLVVGVGEKSEIRLRLAPGAGTCWGVVFVEQRSPTPSGITVAQRIGVKVLAEATGLSREGAVVGMVADTTPAPAALLAFDNQGASALELRTEVEVRALTGEVLAVVPASPMEVLPGRRRIIRVPLSSAGLEPGRYLLVGIVDFNGEYLAGGQTMLEVRP